jgi:hypothetical protein
MRRDHRDNLDAPWHKMSLRGVEHGGDEMVWRQLGCLVGMSARGKPVARQLP